MAKEDVTETDLLLDQAQSVQRIFNSAAKERGTGLVASIYLASTPLADLCVRIVQNQQRLERRLRALKSPNP